jgi:hypothetical protein
MGMPYRAFAWAAGLLGMWVAWCINKRFEKMVVKELEKTHIGVTEDWGQILLGPPNKHVLKEIT